MKRDNSEQSERFNKGLLRNKRFHNRTYVSRELPTQRRERPHGSPLTQLRKAQKEILDDTRNYFVNGTSEETNV